TDRWTLSGVVYGSLHLDRTWELVERQSWLMKINDHVLVPNAYVLLTVSAETALKRLALRGGSKEIYEKKELVTRACERYLRTSMTLLHVQKSFALLTIDAERDIETVKATAVEQVIGWMDSAS